jgi:trans-aconitate methyltransferase
MTYEHPIHAFLAARVPTVSGYVLDLGCGTGRTLAALAKPQRLLGGVDNSVSALHEARVKLPDTNLILADLTQPLGIRDGGIAALVCHNVLELMPDPSRLLTEAGRLLRPGGTAVVSHTDFDSIIVNTSDMALTRRVLRAYAGLRQPWMAACDGRMGRRLPGLVRASPLHVQTVEAVTTVETTYTGQARQRLTEILQGLHTQARSGSGMACPTTRALDTWERDLRYASQAGDFCFAETAFVVTAYNDV